MGKPVELPRSARPDPSLPSMTVEDAVSFCHEQGLDFVTKRTIQTAIYSKAMVRHLVANRVRLSERSVRDWLASTAEADFIPRHVPGRAS